MSFGSGSADALSKPKPKLLGLDELRSSTSEQARPVPYLAGKQKTSVTFISSAFLVHHEPVDDGAKKGGGLAAFNYFASFAALVCIGPVDALHEIWFDDDQVWTAGVTCSSDYEDIVIEGRGAARIYWGTETQDVDPVLETSDEDHPPYRGFCYIVFNDLLFGQGRTDAPNIEVIVSRNIEPPDWFTAAPTIGTDVNLPLVIWDLATNPRLGLGVDESRLDTDSLNEMGATLEDEELGVSPIVNRSQSFRQLLVELLGYVDGYHRNQADGTLAFGLVRPIYDGTDLPLLEADALTSPPRLRPGTWAKTANQAQVQFTDATRYFKENVVSADADATLVITGEFKSAVYSRPWLTNPDSAAFVAQVLAQRNGVPKGEGEITVRKSQIDGLLPGDVFKMHWPQLDLYWLRCRIQSVTWQKAGLPEAQVEFEFERGLLNTVYAGVTAIPNPDRNVLSPEAADFQAVFELPPQLRLDDEQPNVGFLCARPTTAHDLFWIHREIVADTFQQLGDPSPTAEWSLRGYVTSNWDGPDPTPLRVTLTSADSLLATSGALFSQTDIDAGMVYVKATDEFMLVTAAVLVSAGVYDLTLVRAQLDSLAVAHTISEEVWLFHADRLPKYSIPNSHDTETFKYQPGIAGRRVSLADVTEVSVEITWRSARPTSPLNLKAFDDGTNPQYTTGQDIPLTWSPNDRDEHSDLGPLGGLVVSDTMHVEFLTTGDVLVGDVDLGAGTESYDWDNGDLVAALGSETDFKVRVWQKRNGFLSDHYDELLVRKV